MWELFARPTDEIKQATPLFAIMVGVRPFFPLDDGE
jgi:hypothetical protein